MNVIVLSRNPSLYSTQSLVKAFQRRRHFVMVLDHQRFDMVIEDSKMALYYNKVQLQNVDAIIPRIGATATSFGAAVIRHFEFQGVFTACPSEALLRARDKFKCMQYLAFHQIPIPKTLMLNNVEVNASFLNEQLDPPMVVKMKESTHGTGVILSQDANNAQSIAEAFGKLNQETLIQEFIREAKGMDIRAFVVDGEVVGAMRREAAEGDFRSNLHRGGRSYLETLSAAETSIALRATKVLGLKIAGVDILRSDKGPLVLEVNASPGLEGIETTTRIDISGKIVAFVERSAKRGYKS